MKDKIYDPARHNEQSPAPGFASTNTFSPADGETPEGPAEKVIERDEHAKQDDGKSDETIDE
ncbi:MAG: hypothetical protein JWP27_868 [Flaviaesturariibacter sp.]|nr:hypothetical protein [Flaviaesturariibacter sp.]